jgi:hypothetical protein
MAGSDKDKLWLDSAEAIARVIGRSKRDIPRLIRIEGLPAFKFGGRWTALHDDLRAWSKTIADKYRSPLMDRNK